ncbi:MAG: InlB B-repeat-containing protein, partial [Clostridia bacterium]|nr:InlB B-repeat-containing protein [Clostridia bacterium]
MKLKKILLPVIIGVVLMMASIVSVVTGTESEIKLFGSKGRVEAERLMYETPTSTTATDESMFTITKYDNLIYNGAEQTLMTITPLKGTVYYRVVEGTYSVSDALTSSNYSSYPSGGVGETITIKATEVGTYTIYYYIPAVSGSHSELSSSATVSIAKTKESNLFEISINSELVYTGSEQTLMTITPRTGVVYYDVQFGEYNETYASALANNYTSYAKGTENSTVTITATNAGTYTVYYYIPENDNYLAVSSSATITIENVSASVTINPNGGSWDGTTNNSTITQEANSSYAIADPVKEGYHLSSWNGGHTVLTPMELKNKVQIFDGDDYFEHYINYRGSYSKDKLFVSVEAYMDKWSDFSDMVLALDWLGGWSLRNDGEYVAFSICDTSGVTRTAHSLKKSSELESGWHTFVGSFDGEYARLYIDGVLQEVSDRSSGEIDYSYSYGYTFIGADSSGLVGAIADMSFFKGKMRNVYIANACVSSESITSPKPTDDVGYPAIHIASATTDTTLTAQWESNTYTIKFNAKGGTGTMANQTFKYGTEQALRLNAFEKGGYTFGGWTTEDYDLNTTPEAEYTNGHTIYNLTSNHNEQITLYAIWLSSYYTAHVYVMNTGGTYDTAYSAQTMEAGAGTTVTIADEVSKLDAVASDGGLMLDYATDASGNRITTATIGNNTIIKFYLKRSSYTLTFNANGGTVTETSRTLTYQQKYGTLPTPTRTGYECVGWYTEPIGGTPVNENTIMGTESVTIYAHWTANNYTVTFNANGGSVNPSTKSVTYDSTYGALPIPTRAGYNFECWGIGQTATATSNHTNITISNGAVTIGSTHKDTYFNINTAIIAGETYCITFDAEFTNYDSTAWTYNFYKMHGSSSSTNFSLVKGSNIVTVTPSASATSLTWDEVSNDFGSGLVISNIQVFRIVDKDTIVSTAENHTLTAQWSQRAPKVSITSSDTVIEYNSTDITFTAIGEHDFTLNYQWYRGASADFTPSDETKINGATSSTYIQRKDELNCGTYYYKCMVTADYADDTDLTATSDAIEIEITKTDNLFTDKYHPTLGELIYNGTEQVLLEVTATYGTIYYSVNEELDL